MSARQWLIVLLGAASWPAGAGAAQDNPLALAEVGFHELRLLSPTVLELTLVTTKESESAPIREWHFASEEGQPALPAAGDFTVDAGGKAIAVSRVGFKRRALYAPLKRRDLRIGNHLYLELAEPVAPNASVEVKSDLDGFKQRRFSVRADPLRYSPAVHVNQTGYLPAASKKAFIGFYLGSLGELRIQNPGDPPLGFALIAVANGITNFTGTLRPRPERGFTFNCYKRVYEADFTEFKTPGEYRLFVPGFGCSFPFHIGEHVAGWFARTYELGLYHQRCGTSNTLPFTRFIRGTCHTAPASLPDVTFTNSQWLLGQSSDDFNKSPRHLAPQLKNTDASLFPYVRKGTVDVRGGHHDAGDYSKYTINSAALVHLLMTAVDSFMGVAALDNLGIPESGDGKSDLLQEAKWEADFLARMQDDDGGFYFLVYPRNRRYETDVTPDEGDPQVVWPKTTSVTAAAVGALAQCSSSPTLKKQFPEAADLYLRKARKGWEFLQLALKKHGGDGAYQKITHYGHEFLHDDELAWAACELYLATGDEQFHTELRNWLNPRDPRIRKYGWLRMYEGYGSAMRSYALATKAGKAKAAQLDVQFLARCEDEIIAWADQLLEWSQDSAYGTSFPAPTKRVRSAGWFFSCDAAFDLAVASQLDFPSKRDPRPKYAEAILANLNYEAGCNPVNVSYITGLGSRRQREIVHQWAQNDRRVLPMPGIPLGSVQSGFGWLDHYKRELGTVTFPPDSALDLPYPFYDRWGDSFNLSQEFVISNQGRGTATWAWLFAQTSLGNQPWKPASLRIALTPEGRGASAGTRAQLVGPGLNLADASIVWEASGAEPVRARELALPGMPAWIEAEVQMPDGSLAFAVTNLAAQGTAQATQK